MKIVAAQEPTQYQATMLATIQTKIQTKVLKVELNPRRKLILK